MTHKKTHKETKSMPRGAQKLAIVKNDEPLPAPAVEEQASEIEQVEAAMRPEELRLLEALLFAAGEPLDEATLGKQLPNGVDVKEAIKRLQLEYAPRGVNL